MFELVRRGGGDLKASELLDDAYRCFDVVLTSWLIVEPKGISSSEPMWDGVLAIAFVDVAALVDRFHDE